MSLLDRARPVRVRPGADAVAASALLAAGTLAAVLRWVLPAVS